jgi:hypothetical protein
MSLEDFFQKNPFQNLVIASRDAASFLLRGHEQQFEGALSAIQDAVGNSSYRPEKLRHTIVFGEWGHGKTHLLRSVEQKINNDFSSTARAIYYEPSASDPDVVISELATKAGFSCTTTVEFVATLQADDRHQFLLIDESQALVGEDIHGSFDTDISSYYDLLGLLLEASNRRHANLHIFHGLSANSAKAIEKMRAIPTILKLAKNVFTLNSLSEEDQWRMVEDHVTATLKNPGSTRAGEIISKNVNRTVNRLTGGNPRWTLMLMHDIYMYAVNANRDKIDERTCFEALRQTTRIEDPSRKYFDPFLLDEVLERLRNGQIHEQSIAALLSDNWPSLLGGWSTVSQQQLADHDLTAAQARRQCPSLRNKRLLEQTPDADFRPTYDLLDELKITPPATLHRGRDRERLLRLSLQPHTMLRQITDAFESVLRGCYFPPEREHNFGDTSLDALFFDADTAALPDGLRKLRIGLAIYKGLKVPVEFYRVSANRLEEGRCAVIVLIEDALEKHDNPGSTFREFKATYTGPIVVGKRFVFINGSDGNDHQFAENFFVSILDQDITAEKARSFLERVRLKNCIEQAVSESIYCPTEQERHLISRLLGTGSSFNLSELKALDPSFEWATRERLSALSDFIEKRGSKYSRKLLADIKPTKRLLKALSEENKALPEADLENQVRHTWILTGIPEATQLFPSWCITVIEKEGLLQREGNLIRFRDIEKEVGDLLRACDKLTDKVKELIEDYKKGFAPERTKHQEATLTNLKDRIQSASTKELAERGNLLRACQADAGSLMTSLESIPVSVQADLEKEAAHVAELLNALREKAQWRYLDLDNPSLFGARELEGRLTSMKAMINAPIPYERQIRDKIERMRKEIELHLEELRKPTPGSIDAPDSEMSIDLAAFFVFSALRAERNGQVKVEYTEITAT